MAATLVAEADASRPEARLRAGYFPRRRRADWRASSSMTGRIGKVLSGTCFLMSHGMEHWHPDPDFFFKPGGGPILDMGPYYLAALINLLGPVAAVQGRASAGFADAARHPEGADERQDASRSRRRRR